VDPDLPLIQALQAGEDSALNELIRRHREPLFRFVFRYLRDETAAGDVVQETFVRVYFKASKFVSRSTVKTWFYTIALNLCRDQIRRVGRRRGDVSLDVSSTEDQPKPELADSEPGPAENAARSDRFARLQRAIDQLPDKLKSALILCALEGHSQQEAAAICGATPKTIELRVYHAKSKLRKMLEGGPGGAEELPAGKK
jgi:RNA polymerase sigma-70 factor (ECF subfamily)